MRQEEEFSYEEEQYLGKINPTIRNSLNYEQKKEISYVFKRMIPQVQSNHLVDIRLDFWLGRKWYFVLFFGKDTRKFRRITPEKQNKTAFEFIMHIVFYFILIMGLMAIAFMMLYVLKSLLGIDIFPNRHLFGVLSKMLPLYI